MVGKLLHYPNILFAMYWIPPTGSGIRMWVLGRGQYSASTPVAMQIPADKGRVTVCGSGAGTCHVALGRHVLHKPMFFQGSSSPPSPPTCVLLLLFVPRNQKPWGRAGPDHVVGGLTLRSEGCVHVGRQAGGPSGESHSSSRFSRLPETCHSVGGSYALATAGVRFLLISPPWVVGAPAVAAVISRCVSVIRKYLHTESRGGEERVWGPSTQRHPGGEEMSQQVERTRSVMT